MPPNAGNGGYDGLLPQAVQPGRRRCLKWAVVRRCADDENNNVKQDSKTGEGDEGGCNKCVDGQDVSAKSTGEEKESNLKHHRKALDNKVEWPLLESIKFALTVFATLNNRPSGVSQVLVEPLLPQHRNKCGQQRDQKAQEQEAVDGDDFAGRMLLDGCNGAGFVWDCGIVEGEEDSMEESCGLITGIWLKLLIDVDDESCANSREKAHLQGQVRLLTRAHDLK